MTYICVIGVPLSRRTRLGMDSPGPRVLRPSLHPLLQLLGDVSVLHVKLDVVHPEEKVHNAITSIGESRQKEVKV